MKLKSLHLQNFRKFSSSQFKFDAATTILSGQNASGKTSIIEAIDLLSSTESFRAGVIDQMIEFGQEISRVKSVVQDSNESLELEMLLTKGIVQGKRTAKRLYSINQVRKRKKDFLGKLVSVVFRPEDMRLIEGSPTRRRNFLDSALGLMIKGYPTSLSTYEQALKKRNKLLIQVREGEMPRAVLTFWNQQLIKHGQILQAERQKFLSEFKIVEFPLQFSIQYQPSEISTERVEKYLGREIASGHTLIGPHKDDFIVNLSVASQTEAFDIAIYGSRGQQRLAVLWLKFCEVVLLERHFQHKVILLLDDILSELDEFSQEKVLSLISDRQTIISTADPDTLEDLKSKLPDASLISL